MPAADASRPPLFVLGSPRSGTTLARLMLACHPGLSAPPEGDFALALRARFGGFAGGREEIRAFACAVVALPKLEHWNLSGSELADFLVERAPQSYSQLAALVYRCWAIRDGKPDARWVHKNNFYVRRVAELSRLFPHACFLHVVRDGRDVACSYRDMAAVRGRYAPRLPRGVLAAAHAWREDLRAVRAARTRLGPGRLQEIRYEDLVRDPRETLGEVCFFLGEPFDEAMLEFDRINRLRQLEPKAYHAWKWRTREPLTERAVGRHEREMFSEDRWLFEGVAGDALRAYGYPLAARGARPLQPIVGAASAAWRASAPLRRAGRRAGRGLSWLRDALPARRPGPEKWVFVVGCYNSGTTLLHDVIAAHPDVARLPREGQDLTDALPQPRRLGLPRLWALRPERFRLDERAPGAWRARRMRRQWSARFRPAGRPVWLEKSPTHAARVRWLDRHFEDAHFVAIVRNGYAVAEGIRRKAGHELALGAEQWARSNQVLLDDLERVPRGLVVRYEDLAERPDEVARRVLVFLGLEPLEPGALERLWRVHERTSAIRDLNPESFGRLDAAERETVTRAAGPMLRRLGYEVLR